MSRGTQEFIRKKSKNAKQKKRRRRTVQRRREAAAAAAGEGHRDDASTEAMSRSVRRRRDDSREHGDVDRSEEEDRHRTRYDDDLSYPKHDGGDCWRDDSCSDWIPDFEEPDFEE